MAGYRTFDTAAQRWAGVGPYYAMFPVDFADAVVRRYTDTGDFVLDPFAGRGTAIFSAAQQGRTGLGIEINPVGWVYARAKLNPASKERVIERIESLGHLACDHRTEAQQLPAFFRSCFSAPIRRFLCAARTHLNWKTNRIDTTTMAFLLVYLHGKREAALSNQMRQTKSMAPDYSIRWWHEHRMKPPSVDPVAFLAKRVEWRYAKGRPVPTESKFYLGDSRIHLARLSGLGAEKPRAKLLITSPPYYSLTNYHYDQWLRLWLLGGRSDAKRVSGTHELRAKFEHASRYRQLLQDVMERASDLLVRRAIVYVRTGRDEVTYTATTEVLKEAFPRKRMFRRLRPYTRPTQTRLFGDLEEKPGEVDLVLLPR